MNLTYDVGFHDGSDTAYYLHRGFRVIAVDANPHAILQGKQRFGSALASGQLTLLHVAVGGEEGTADFWVSSHQEYSSFDRANAEKYGQTATRIEVPVQRLERIVAQYGKPH